jgi:hypothetical protein
MTQISQRSATRREVAAILLEDTDARASSDG